MGYLQIISFEVISTSSSCETTRTYELDIRCINAATVDCLMAHSPLGYPQDCADLLSPPWTIARLASVSIQYCEDQVCEE